MPARSGRALAGNDEVTGLEGALDGVTCTMPFAASPGVTVTVRVVPSPRTCTGEVPSAATEGAAIGTVSTSPSVLLTVIVSTTEAPTSEVGAASVNVTAKW